MIAPGPVKALSSHRRSFCPSEAKLHSVDEARSSAAADSMAARLVKRAARTTPCHPARTIILSLILLSSLAVVAYAEVLKLEPEDAIPGNDEIKTEAMAIQIAKEALIPVYGEKQIESEEPFSAHLEGDVWFVHGHLPEGWVGGVAEVTLAKKDGRVIRMIHGK